MNLDDSLKGLRYVMDDTSIPCEDNENPYPITKEDENYHNRIIKKYGLVTKDIETEKEIRELRDKKQF